MEGLLESFPEERPLPGGGDVVIVISSYFNHLWIGGVLE